MNHILGYWAILLLMLSGCASKISGQPDRSLRPEQRQLPYQLLEDRTTKQYERALNSRLTQLGFHSPQHTNQPLQFVSLTIKEHSRQYETPRWRSYRDAGGSLRVEIDPSGVNRINDFQWHIALQSHNSNTKALGWTISMTVYGAHNEVAALNYFLSQLTLE